MAKKKPDLDVQVEFSQLSIGETSARLGMKIDRENIEAHQCEDFLCGARLDVELRIGEKGQSDLPGVPKIDPIKTTVDVKSYGAKIKNFTAGLTFNVTEVDVSLLAHYAQKQGRLIATRIGDASSGGEEE